MVSPGVSPSFTVKQAWGGAFSEPAQDQDHGQDQQDPLHSTYLTKGKPRPWVKDLLHHKALLTELPNYSQI